MKWLRWFGWRKKGSYSYIFSESSTPSQLLCRNNPGGNYKKMFKTKCMNFGATEQRLGHVSGAERREIVFLEAMEDWKWDWRQLSSPRLTVCPAHFVFALVSWPHWTGNEREGEEEVLSAGSAKIKLAGERKCWSKKKKEKKEEVDEKTTMTKKNLFAVRPTSCLQTTRNSPISGIIIFLACENVKSIVHK